LHSAAGALRIEDVAKQATNRRLRGLAQVFSLAASLLAAVLLAVHLFAFPLGPTGPSGSVDPAGSYLAGLAALVASLLALGLFAYSLASFVAYGRRFGAVDRAIFARGAGTSDLGTLITTSHETGIIADIPGVGAFLIALNDDVTMLQRSGVKFDLFASDILFSSRNLARQSETQLEMLVRLRERSQSYFAKLQATSRDLEDLTRGVDGYVAGADLLRDRALGSRDLLGEVSRATAEATAAATGGATALGATKVSAEGLMKGIRELDRVVEKEATEARRIGEALRVIEDIVERTHILATNASIEAAHAGTRGAGFGVIAQEIRKLAASSRASLADITTVLGSIATGIADSARLSAASSESAKGLGATVADSQSRFAAIVDRVGAVDRILGKFAGVFSDQIEAASGLATEAGEASRRIGEFGRVFGEGAVDYQVIAEAAGSAESGAQEAQRSSRVLAQLSGYLKIGGMERNRVLRKYLVLESAASARFPRKENRQLLLYNLEIFGEDGALIGYLGDLSPSGMLILAERELVQDSRHHARIVLPLSSEGERSVEVAFEARRLERDSDGLRIGCRFLELGSADLRVVQELLGTLTLAALTSPQVQPESQPADLSMEVEDLEEA
jgi:methyl-accepting chemotaxis protein